MDDHREQPPQDFEKDTEPNDLEAKFCIIGSNGSRLEVSNEEYHQAKTTAESQMKLYPDLADVKIRQLIGDALDKADKINLQAAETFPNDRKLFALMVRSLSPDIQSAKLNDQEQAELDKALKNS